MGAAVVLVAGCGLVGRPGPGAGVGRGSPSASSAWFFAIGDPQINVARWGTAGTERTIGMMNELPGEPFPWGGVVEPPAGVVILGDLVDDLTAAGDWNVYRDLFDPQGRARLRFPAFEGLGNHDVDVRSQPTGVLGPHQRAFIDRNRRRRGDFVFDPDGYHYSWEWAGVRFIQLNLFPGTVPRPVYDAPAPGNDPRGSLVFLRRVLEEQVGESGEPVVLLWHYGLRGWGLEKWWTEEDLDALDAVLEGYDVVLILHGHEHRYERYRWRGRDVVMAPSPQSDRDPEAPDTESRPKGFLVFRITPDELQMAHRTPDGWAETWSTPLRAPAPVGAGPDGGGP